MAICSVRPTEGVVQVWSKRFAWLATAIRDREGNLCTPLAPHVVRDAATGNLVGIEGRERLRAVLTFGPDAEDLDPVSG